MNSFVMNFTENYYISGQTEYRAIEKLRSDPITDLQSIFRESHNKNFVYKKFIFI